VSITQDTPQEIQKTALQSIKRKTWSTICVDLIGPYDVITKDNIEIILNAMTINNPNRMVLKIVEIPNKSAV
jgi:hypothetical protein